MFDGIVRGYRGHGMGSGFGGVIVEVGPGAVLPPADWLVELGPGTREGDGLEIPRAVEVVGDWRPCRDIAEALADQPVRVSIDGDGLPLFTPRRGDDD